MWLWSVLTLGAPGMGKRQWVWSHMKGLITVGGGEKGHGETPWGRRRSCNENGLCPSAPTVAKYLIKRNPVWPECPPWPGLHQVPGMQRRGWTPAPALGRGRAHPERTLMEWWAQGAGGIREASQRGSQVPILSQISLILIGKYNGKIQNDT